MSWTEGGITENFDLFLWILSASIILTFVLSALLMNQQVIETSTGVTGIGVGVALLSVAISHYWSKISRDDLRNHHDGMGERYDQELEYLEQQLEEARKTRLSEHFEERVAIVEDAISSVDSNIACLNASHRDLDFDPILELENLDPIHQEYFEDNHSDLLSLLEKQGETEENLLDIQGKTRKKLTPIIERYLGNDSTEEGAQWLREVLLTGSVPSEEQIRTKIDPEHTNALKIRAYIEQTYDDIGGTGIYPYHPQPGWWQPYLEDLKGTENYYISVRKKLTDIRTELRREGT